MKVFIWLIVLVLSIPALLFSAFVASTLWLWFMVPLGLPAIGVLHMWGIGLFASYFTMGIKRESPETTDATLGEKAGVAVAYIWLMSLLWGGVALGTGYILQGLI